MKWLCEFVGLSCTEWTLRHLWLQLLSCQFNKKLALIVGNDNDHGYLPICSIVFRLCIVWEPDPSREKYAHAIVARAYAREKGLGNNYSLTRAFAGIREKVLECNLRPQCGLGRGRSSVADGGSWLLEPSWCCRSRYRLRRVLSKV